MLKYYYLSPKRLSKKFSFSQKKFLLPFFLIIVGLGVIFYVVLPIASFQLHNLPLFTSRNLTSPLPDILALPQILEGVDYTKASNWFPTASRTNTQGLASPKTPSSYLFSIPKLGIQKVFVSTTSDDLSKNLVHYGGSSLPGEKGNAVIFGHSTLPQFFNPQNYKTIFSTLHTLTIGDKIATNIDGVTYQYSIFEIKIVNPQDISPLEQRYDGSYITVITCTPPGTYWKRLIIKGRLEGLDQG